MPGPNDRATASPTRRAVLAGLLATSGAPFLSGCGVVDRFRTEMPEGDMRGRAALLLPLTGPQAQLGQSLREAASLGGTTVGTNAEIEVLDSGGTPESAVRAARAGVEAGARMLIGPLFSAQARAVAGAVPKGVPVVALSNDDTLAATGVFVYGVTPLQSARSVLGHAAAQGMRDIGIAAPPGPLSMRAIEGAQRVAQELGLTLRAPVTTADPAALRAAYGSDAPDAVYLPNAGPELAGLVAAAKEMGVQPLGSAQWSGLDIETDPTFEGAVFAAPDPLRFQPFSREMEARGVTAGIVAGLVFDGVEMARLLGRLGQQDRKGLLRDKGFDGVLGAYRFQPSGTALRGLAVLAITGDGTSVVGTSAV